MSSNVYQLFPGDRDSRPSARSAELDRVEARFRSLRRSDEDVYRHLARQMHGYLAEVEQRGARTGAIGRIIGGDEAPSAKHRMRFSWNGGERDFTVQPLNKTPGAWLGAFRRCARELGRSSDDLLLEAFTGSRLKPALRPADLSEEGWRSSFRELMAGCEASLCSDGRAAEMFRYLDLAGLHFQGEELISSFDGMISEFDPAVPHWEAMLEQVPYAPVCTLFRASCAVSSPSDRARIERVAEGGRRRWRNKEISLVLLVRHGLAVVPGPGNGLSARLALFAWPNLYLEVEQRNWTGEEILTPIGSAAVADTLAVMESGIPSDTMGMISFAPLGTDAFDALAERCIGSHWLPQGDPEEDCWDPASSEQDKRFHASSSPDRTIAAVIERNLLFADNCSVPAHRLDRVLHAALEGMTARLQQHRTRVEDTTAHARQRLLASWQRGRDEGTGGTGK